MPTDKKKNQSRVRTKEIQGRDGNLIYNQIPGSGKGVKWGHTGMTEMSQAKPLKPSEYRSLGKDPSVSFMRNNEYFTHNQADKGRLPSNTQETNRGVGRRHTGDIIVTRQGSVGYNDRSVGRGATGGTSGRLEVLGRIGTADHVRPSAKTFGSQGTVPHKTIKTNGGVPNPGVTGALKDRGQGYSSAVDRVDPNNFNRSIPHRKNKR
jgi:hypothetical protein